VAAGSSAVRYERSGAAAVLTIDRPERRNAIDGATAQALHAGFRAFAEDEGARVMIVTGAGDEAFCAGADLKALETLEGDAPGGPLGFTRLASPKPTIAAVSGWCLAGVEEADRFGLVTEIAARPVERALAMAEAIAAFPQDTMLSDRRAVLEGAGLPLVQGLALEARLGRGRLETGLAGAQRFAAGEGRGGSGTGI
jgi:enoyl-CoA hydratase/carnithine racemase